MGILPMHFGTMRGQDAHATECVPIILTEMNISDLIGNVDEFPVLKKWAYLNHAGISPLPARVAKAMRTYIDHAEANSYIDADWFTAIDTVRAAAATLINAEPGEITLIKNTSEGVSTVAFGLKFEAGDRIVLADVEYPANVYPWMETSLRTGAELVVVPSEVDGDGRSTVSIDKLLAAADHPHTKVVTVSHVQYITGQRMDVARLGAFCRERGICFHVDVIQSLGALPVDVKTMQIDCLSTGSHKWLLAPPGAGIMYIRNEWRDRIRPLLIGATSVVDYMNFGHIDYTLRPDGGRYESGSPNLAGLLGLGASLAMFNGVGAAAIASQIKGITSRLVDGLELAGYTVASPRTGDAWSGIVSFTAPGLDLAATVAALRKDHQVEILVREGKLRCSPHFYNTEVQMDQLLAGLPKV